MKIAEVPRSAEQRRRGVLARLEHETDIWVASSGTDGTPCLVPLWFLWDGEAIWVSTRVTNPTGRNLRDNGRARLALGDTEDVVLIDGRADAFTAQDVPGATADAFAKRRGWDPRQDHHSYAYFRVRPHAIQAWHGEHELAGRHVMRNGDWVV
ncbi:pyridoxamine 5'-phosphate oxidase family protein [Streptomyces sp. NPDC088246]|uniref:pyridoxamine 5'-phosphate oxidase family protein n=1 Tax=Streptomyces sp. NPDC088246 TaxID=3365842 RepID=UPI0037F50604